MDLVAENELAVDVLDGTGVQYVPPSRYSRGPS